MGFSDFRETDVLVHIKDGVYFYKPNNEEQDIEKRRRQNVEFDKQKKILIYDSS